MNDNKVAKEIELMTEAHKREMEAIKGQYRDLVKVLEQQLKESRETGISKDATLRELERICLDKDGQARTECEAKVKKTEEEYKQRIKDCERNCGARISEKEAVAEKMKIGHMREIELIKRQYEDELKQLRDKNFDLSSKLQSVPGTDELHKLKSEFEEYKRKNKEQTDQLIKQRDDAMAIMQHNITERINCRNSPKNIRTSAMNSARFSIPCDGPLDRTVSMLGTEKKNVTSKESSAQSVECINWDECESGTEIGVYSGVGLNQTKRQHRVPVNGAFNIENIAEMMDKIGKTELKQLKE